MPDKIESAVLFFAEGPLQQMVETLCRSCRGEVVLADGDNDALRSGAIAFARKNGLPLVLISAREECPLPEEVRAVCLTRPFLFAHLQETLQNLCSLPAEPVHSPKAIPLVWEPDTRKLHCREKSIALTEREAALFDILWAAAPGFVPEETLRGVFQRSEGNGLQVYVTYLRRKLKQLPLSIHITSRRGEGYALLIPENPQS